MTFLNPAFLFGLAAALVPVLLHLWHRRRPDRVRWGATHLLVQTVEQRSRRIRLEQLILVLIRAAILVALAMLMARPLLTSLAPATALSGGSVHSVVILDTSYSMAQGDLLERAKRAAREVLESLGNDDTFTLIRAGERPRVVTLDDPGSRTASRVAAWHEAIDATRAVAGASDLVGAVAVAQGILESSRAATSEVAVLTDRQERNWPPADRQRLRQRLQNLRDIPTSPAVWWLDLDPGPPAAENLWIEELRVAGGPAVVGRAVAIEVVVATSSRELAGTALDVTLQIDGQRVGTKQLVAPAQGTARVRFEHAFEQAGDSRVVASFEFAGPQDRDALAVDNTSRAVVRVLDEVPVLLVRPPVASDALEGGSRYLELALRPEAGRTTPGLLDVRLETRSHLELAGGKLDTFDAIILYDVPHLPGGIAEKLDAYVRGGGGLIVFAGASLVPSYYNRNLHDDGKGVLAARIDSLLGGVDAPSRSVTEIDAAHPALAVWAAAGVELERLRVHRFAEVTPDGSSRVLARLDGGVPFLLEKEFGTGRSLLLTTSLDTSWSSLPLRLSFVPFCQDLLAYVVGGERASLRVLRPGEAIVRSLDVESGPAVVTVRLPGGSEETTTAAAAGTDGERARVEYRGTDEPGFYSLFLPGGEVELEAVQPDSEESRLDAVEPIFLRRLADDELLSYRQGDPGASARALIASRRGLELATPLIVLACILLLVELWVEQSIERGRRG